jgi:AraC-like DNA-binding protein
VRTIAGLRCTRARGGSEFGVLKPQSIHLILQIAGRSIWRGANRDIALNAGEAALIDGASGEFIGAGLTSDCFSIEIPRQLMAARFRRSPDTSIRGATAALLAALVRSAYDNAWDLKVEPAAAVRDALLSLIGAGWGGSPAPLAVAIPRGGEPVVMQQLKAYIAQHLENPALSPLTIARAQGVSVRHLHRLFKAGGVSLGDWIRQRRLAHCAADLADAAYDGQSLTEIAFRWGFSDSAHFSRSFRAQYGVAPRDYRAGRKSLAHFTPPEGLACS